jgi:CheY-like chemotaxis protein
MNLENDVAVSTRPMCSVLILEDEPLIAAMIQDLVEELRCRVVGPAHRLEQAFDLLACQAIDFAILDINVEGVSSYPLAEELMRRQIPFLFTTGYEVGDIDQSFGCPVISKPFDPSFLQGKDY